MSTHVVRWLHCAMVLVLLIAAIGCFGGRVGELRIESQSVDLGGAKSVRAQIRIGGGEVRIGGGATRLMEADFLYNVSGWKPEITYRVNGNQGALVVQQPKAAGFPRGNLRYEWNLNFNNTVPIDLNVDLGAGKSDLELGDLALTGLDIQIGAGEVVVDLNGEWKSDLEANVKGGVGKLTLRLPGKVGVRVDASKGIGSINTTGLTKEGSGYVNEAMGKSPVTLRIHVAAGVGDINLESG